MLSRRITAVRPLARALRPAAFTAARPQLRYASEAPVASAFKMDEEGYPDLTNAAEEDPDMNGGYVNPPRVKRQHRDPYGDWWDKQERRNYGEPLHEDNDILGMFTPEDYNHFTPGWAAVLLGTFVATAFGFIGVIRLYYPDKPSVPRTFPDGLEKELGGHRALTARKEGEDEW